MRAKPAAIPGLILLGLALCHAARAAVMTADIQVTGAGPYTITYYLAQQATTMQVKIFSANATLIRTIDATTITDATAPGKHDGTTLPAITWDGNKTDGTAAPRGTYYIEISTTGDAVSNSMILAGPTAFTPQPGATRTEARNTYGGDVNRNPASPYHNLAYFAVGKTNTNNNGSSGVEVVRPDASSTIFVEDGAEGAYDYVASSVLSDDSILLGGQGQKKLRNVSPVDGSLIADYAAGKVDVRGMQAYGAGPSARVYFVDDQTPNGPLTGSVALLDPISKTTGTPIYQTIVSQAQIAEAIGLAAGTVPGTRNVVVNRAETALWVCGNQGGSLSPTNQFVLRFDKVGGAWQKSSTFNTLVPIVMSGVVRGIALSPDEKTLWVSNADGNDAGQSNLFALDASTGADKGFQYQLFVNGGGGDFQPQGMTTSASDTNYATASYNIFVAGFSTFAQAVTTANYVAVVAPPDSGSHDTTRSPFFDVTLGATAVSVTSGPTVSNITSTGATVTWETDFRSDSTVHLGTQAGAYTLGDTSALGITTTHQVNLQNLAPGTTYFYQVESRKDPLSPATATGQFTTLADIRVLSETLAAQATSAAVNLTLNVPAAGTVAWGDAPDALTRPAITLSRNASQSISFSGLAPGKTYYYKLSLSDPAANPYTGAVSAFATAASGGSEGSVPDTSFGPAHKVNLVFGTGGRIELPKQGVPNAPSLGPGLPQALFDAAEVAYNGYFYVIGGADTTATATANVYYIKINADGTLDATGWKTASNPLPAPRAEIANMAFGYNGRIYVIGGLDASTPAATQATVLSAAQNPATGDLGPWAGLDNTGNPVNPLPEARMGASAFVADGSVYVSGGGSATAQSTVYVAPMRPDGTLGAWTATSSLPTPLWYQRTLANQHIAYSVGGEKADASKVDTTYIANDQPNGDLSPFIPVTNYPSAVTATMDIPHVAMAAGILGGKIVTVGGGENEPVSGDIQGITRISMSKLGQDGLPQAWVDASTVNSGAVLATMTTDMDGAAYNNVMYVAGGREYTAYGPDGSHDGRTAPETAETTVNVIAMNADPSDSGYAYAGTLESRVIDLGALTNLKHITVSGTGVSAASVEVRYRFANEDKVFTDWFSAASPDADITGGARYVQYELALKGNGSATPSVSSLGITTAAGTVPAFTVADVQLALRIAGGLATPQSGDVAKLDVDGDKAVTVRDAVAIDRTINGK